MESSDSRIWRSADGLLNSIDPNGPQSVASQRGEQPQRPHIRHEHRVSNQTGKVLRLIKFCAGRGLARDLKMKRRGNR